jgi:hypothetical protein
MPRPVKVYKDPRGYYHLALDPELGRLVPADMLFIPELTDEGILFRPEKLFTTPEKLPEWIKNGPT